MLALAATYISSFLQQGHPSINCFSYHRTFLNEFASNVVLASFRHGPWGSAADMRIMVERALDAQHVDDAQGVI